MAALVALLAGQAMATMDGSILTVAAPSLRADLHASGAELQLVVVMYTIALAALVVTGARLGDIIGPRRAFVRSLAVFSLASLAGGLAPSASVLIAARTLQGAAAAVMTPQVLSIIQTRYEGCRRERAIGAYSMILAAGVAAGQIVGGLIVTAHLLAAAWRPALLLNAPVGAVVLASSRRALPQMPPGSGGRLDLRGVWLLATALIALIVPLSIGRDHGWPAWVWPCLAGCVLAACGFVLQERRVAARGFRPLFDVSVLKLPGVATGVLAVFLIMACYSGFVLAFTLRLQTGLGFSALHAGLIFAIYATGFAIASLTWTRVVPAVRAQLPVFGPLLMGGALLFVGLLATNPSWPLDATAPLLLIGGAGHAWGFAPLTNRLTTLVAPSQAADLSGLMLTADWTGIVLGVATFTSIYLSTERHNAPAALALTTAGIGAGLLATSICASRALAHARRA